MLVPSLGKRPFYKNGFSNEVTELRGASPAVCMWSPMLVPSLGERPFYGKEVLQRSNRGQGRKAFVLDGIVGEYTEQESDR